MNKPIKSLAFCRWIVLLLLVGKTGFTGSLAAFAETAAGSTNASSEVDPGWVLSTTQFNNSFEAQAFIGNGYVGLRIPAAGMGYLGNLGKIGWPLGTERITSSIAAGLFAKVADGTFYHDEKQALALIPTWSTLSFGDASGIYSPESASAANVRDYRQTLDLKTGFVATSGVWTSPGGKRTRFTYRIATDRARSHIAIVELELTPLWSGTATIISQLDNAGARRLRSVASSVDDSTNSIYQTSTTLGTSIPVSEAATLRSTCDLSPAKTASNATNRAEQQVSFRAQSGKTCSFVKYVAVVTGRDSTSPESDARRESQEAADRGWPAFQSENRSAWQTIWNADIEVEGDPGMQQAIRANQFSLFASINATSPGSLGPSGLSSDGYAGMVFWDADTWMFPALLLQHPDLARVLVDYRSNTLPAALKNAKANGYAGAFYPWTSGIAGDMGDECYGAVTDASGKVVSDPNKSCTQQFHLQSDVALAQWQYYQSTGDKTWLAERGWPVLESVAQFWVSKATPTAGGYGITQVQTPDEYATDTNNDAYTNVGAALELKAAQQAAAILGKTAPPLWDEIASGLVKTIPVDETRQIYLEHEGYTGQQIKQADVVMLTYPLDFAMPKSYGINNLNYYAPLTDVNGPAMTDAIHSIAAAALDAPGCSAFTYTLRSYQPFLREPYLNFSEFAPSSLTMTAFNFLTGIGGFMQEFLYGYSGYRPLTTAVHLDPTLPPQLAGITLRNLAWQGRTFTIHIGPKESQLTLKSGEPLPVFTPAGLKTVEMGSDLVLPTRRPDLLPTTDIARCRKITASSSDPGSPSVAAVDGTTATAWVATGPQANLTVDLATVSTVNGIRVVRGSREPFSYSVQISSDGKQWRKIAESKQPVNETDEYSIPGVKAKFVRLVFGGPSKPNIAELSVTSAGH
jgi:trehalose/maltose hydrolase-like predicted phosphorylase